MQIEELYSIYEAYPSVQTDTRKLKEGDLYFALKGPNFNGNEFATKAIEAGAAFAIIDDKRFFEGQKMILVEDALQTLQQLSNYHRKQFNIPFIAITGSNGKTTTKELIHAVLSSTYITYTTEGNLNNHIGVPLTILKIRKDAQMAVIEMGANHLSEISGYCQIALPDHGLITNCGKAHLEGFGSEEAIRRAKGELFDHLRGVSSATAFVNWDYAYLHEMSKGISGVIKYGTTPQAHIFGKVLRNDPLLEVEVIQGLDGKRIRTQLVGEYNLPNVLAAVTVGKYFSVPDGAIRLAIEEYSPSNSRSQLLQHSSNSIILDAYNANPSSMHLAIENLAKLPGENKVLVLGAMAELGKESVAEHQAIIDLIGKYDWKAVALVGGDFLKIRHPWLSFNNAEEAAGWYRLQQFTDSYILVKGSRSMRMEKVTE